MDKIRKQRCPTVKRKQLEQFLPPWYSFEVVDKTIFRKLFHFGHPANMAAIKFSTRNKADNESIILVSLQNC